MTRGGYHRMARVGAFVVCASVAVWLLAPPRPLASPAPAVIRIDVPARPTMASAEPLFAESPVDAVPARGGSGLPQLIGIVGRLPAPLAMVRLEDGAVRTIGRGEAAGGWTLESVAADRATFRRGGEARVSVLPPR